MRWKSYAEICKKKYAQICVNMQIICNNMHRPINYGSKALKRKYAKICTKYAIMCKICRHEIYMQNMQKFALPTLLMVVSPESRGLLVLITQGRQSGSSEAGFRVRLRVETCSGGCVVSQAAPLPVWSQCGHITPSRRDCQASSEHLQVG